VVVKKFCPLVRIYTNILFKVCEWSSREDDFVKRAGFVLMAVLPFHNKKADFVVFFLKKFIGHSVIEK